jgi:diguanylate cyclase (GGDEF)-like protein
MTTYEGIIDESGNLLAWIISIAYPVFDFILVFSALTLFVIKDKSNMFIIHIGLGYLLMSFTDLVYMILVNHNAYTTGSFIDPLWSISFLLIATADYTRKGEYLQNFHQKLLNALNYDAYKRAYLLIIPTIILLVLFNAYIIDDYNIMILVGYSLTSFLLIVRHDLANRQSNELKHELQSRIQLLENNKINLNENVSELKYKFEKTLEKVDRDHLTGVYNRRYIDQQKSTINDDYGDNNEYSVLIMDIDNFKGINDTYGHQIGDDILVEIASIMKLNARESEMLGRYGGDEFIMFLPGVNSEEAFIVADRIRNEIMCQIIRIEEKKIQCTISVGIANTTEKEFNSIDDIIRRADNRLYLAKKRGRNNVVKDDN